MNKKLKDVDTYYIYHSATTSVPQVRHTHICKRREKRNQIVIAATKLERMHGKNKNKNL